MSKKDNNKIENIKKLIDDGEIDKALEITDANDIEFLSDLGTSFGKKGSHKIAEKIFNRITQINPKSAGAWSNKGIVLGNLGKYDDEIKCYDKAIKINTDYDKAWYNKGLALLNLGKYDEAIKCFDQAIKINPNDAKAWSSKGIAHGNLGKYDEAIKSFDEALKINHHYDEAWYNKGVTLGMLVKHYEAIKCYDKAIKINPDYDKAWNNKGIALAKLGKYNEAIKCFDQAIKINPNDADALINKGVALGNIGKPDEEIKCFDQAIKINPNHDKAWFNKGIVIGNLGKHDEEIKCYDMAIKINPNDAEAWSNKGVTLGNIGKPNEEIKCYKEAIKINPNYAEAYANLGITFLNLRKYDKAVTELRKAKELFSKKGLENDAKKAHKFEIWAINASELISKLGPLDEQFLSSLNSRSLKELREKSLEISEGIEGVIKEFEEREISKDVNILLINKAICFTALSNALKFEKVDLKQLRDTKIVFENWHLKEFVRAINYLDTFIKVLKKYNNIDEISKEIEELLLHILRISDVLDGELTEEITDKIKGKPYTAKPTVKGKEKEPKIIYKYIADTQKQWVRFCLVQMDFSLKSQHAPKEYGNVLKEKGKIKNKIFKALDIANKNKVDVICFPELSFAKGWVEEIKDKYNEMIIIGGSYYDGGHNVCPIIINGEYIDPTYKKCCPSPIENPETTGRGMKSGNIIYIFQTKCGRFSVLTCIDYTKHSRRVCEYEEGNCVDFIINPSYDKNIFRFQSRCNSDCEDYDINVIQVNKSPDNGKYGGTCIIGKEHDDILNKLINDGFKPKDDIKYKLFQLNCEMMIIANLNIRIKAPPVSLPIGYTGRIRISKEQCYKYENEIWLPLSN